MKTILVLEDEQTVRESLADYFEDRLWQTLQAESAEEALELMEPEPPSAAVVDVRLPGMDGNDFIPQALKRNTRMAFVSCTGSPEYVVPPDLLRLPGVSECLFKKPITRPAELEEEILRIADQLESKESEDE